MTTRTPSELSGVRALLLIAGVTVAAATVGAAASIDAPAFYAELIKPAWAPPASLFGPVWTMLYIAMAAAAWLVVRTGETAHVQQAIVLYVTQLAFNALWSWLFFRWRLGAVAFIEVLVLWALVLWTTRRFWQVRLASGLLMLPYALWVTFAAALTFAVWRLNPGLL